MNKNSKCHGKKGKKRKERFKKLSIQGNKRKYEKICIKKKIFLKIILKRN
jgi:hypothetical protein